MTAQHHCSEDLLLAYAAGSLDEPRSLLLASHLALCPQCRASVATAESLGGALMESLGPTPLSESALDGALARLDEPEPTEPSTRSTPIGARDAATALPQPLRDYLQSAELDPLRWRWVAPGIQRCDIAMRGTAHERAKAYLLRLRPETVLPRHGHAGDEMTMVLEGGYTDDGKHYLRGDVQLADQTVEHQPVIDPGEACVALVVTDAPLRFVDWLPRLLQPILAR